MFDKDASGFFASVSILFERIGTCLVNLSCKLKTMILWLLENRICSRILPCQEREQANVNDQKSVEAEPKR